jgi:pyruvate dehydrogenase E2 component (dihydrolipoamide acetyltransferase)
VSEFQMPSLGADMAAGTLLAWRKSPGDQLAKGDTIAEVDTDKGVIDVEVFHPGVLDEILVAAGTKVPVGTPLARIREAGEPGERPRSETRPIEPDRGAGLQPATPGPPAQGDSDVESAASGPSHPLTESPADRMRRSIAAAMTRSNREIPHYHLWTTIDLERATRWLNDVNPKRPVEGRLLPGVLLLKATALALGKHPEFSAVWEDDRVRLRQPFQIGVAISLRGGGLVVATLHDAATRSLDDLMAGLRDLTTRARTGRLTSSELADSTLTVTSLGDRGVEGVLGVIYPPQVALVGFGRIADRPWAIDGQVVARPLVTASLAADHRASDGHRGGLFLAAIDGLLQEPGKL